MEIRYLSQGAIKTGGYRHELFFAQELQRNIPLSSLKTLRLDQNFSGLSHLKMQWWGFKNSNSETTIVGFRLALVVLLRNLFSKNRIFIVLHNFDAEDGKPLLLQWYYSMLFRFIGFYNSRVSIIAVSPFFKLFFEQKLKREVFLFPNFFDTHYLENFKTLIKQKKIHLGQWSPKNSHEIFTLANSLKQNGYSCYFSSLDKKAVTQNEDYEVVYFDTYSSYLQQMAESLYTIAFPKVNEGWNRVAHESILVGTPVIGFNKGGLGDLLMESKMCIVTDAQSALDTILQNVKVSSEPAFLAKYDIANASIFLQKMGV